MFLVEIVELEEEFTKKTSMRSVNLQLLLEREDLPAPAKAMEKQQDANDRNEDRKALKAETKEFIDEQDAKEEIEVEEAAFKPFKPIEKKLAQKKNTQKKAEQRQNRAAKAKR